MCLDTVFLEKPNSEGFGYKVFIKRGRFLYSEFFPRRRTTKKWVGASWTEVSSTATTRSTLFYKPAWHVFTKLSDAKKWLTWAVAVTVLFSGKFVIRKVKYNGAHTQGRQRGCDVIVANGLYIFPGDLAQQEV